MKKLNNLNKIGLIMMAIAFVMMLVCIVINQPVYDLIAWVFGIGIIICLLGALVSCKKNKK